MQTDWDDGGFAPDFDGDEMGFPEGAEEAGGVIDHSIMISPYAPVFPMDDTGRKEGWQFSMLPGCEKYCYQWLPISL